MADPKLMAQFMAVKALLDPGEAMQILALGERFSGEQQEWLIAQVGASSPAEAAALLRSILVEVNEAKAATATAE